MEQKAGYLIEYATWQHEPRMLEEILDYEVGRNRIRHNQINLRTALNNALFCRSSRMKELFLSEKTMDFLALIDNPRPLEWAVKYPNIHALILFLTQPKFRFDKGAIEEGVALNLMLHKVGNESGVGIDSLDELLKRGARMRYEGFGMTAIHVAAKLGGISVMETLVDNLTEDEIQNDINRTCSRSHGSQGREGKTALAITVMTGRFETVKCLLDNGADSNVVDADGKTALQLAREAGWGDFVEAPFRGHGQ
ncbi:ankyrin repeat-containing domain protein [Alternaria rosae]|uniref:ankyrin repeat-containing domain protein n=1 Tax=Alternaria rosae TaxID=1187941 RepID=UPI001E8E1316|nr:ankyrin repeat-containing domain protein [Alternaria rosae]KAH6865288.1 ankyrin repeat-containing domain protein [Alternaria rosae]